MVEIPIARLRRSLDKAHERETAKKGQIRTLETELRTLRAVHEAAKAYCEHLASGHLSGGGAWALYVTLREALTAASVLPSGVDFNPVAVTTIERAE